MHATAKPSSSISDYSPFPSAREKKLYEQLRRKKFMVLPENESIRRRKAYHKRTQSLPVSLEESDTGKDLFWFRAHTSPLHSKKAITSRSGSSSSSLRFIGTVFEDKYGGAEIGSSSSVRQDESGILLDYPNVFVDYTLDDDDDDEGEDDLAGLSFLHDDDDELVFHEQQHSIDRNE